MTTPLLPEQPTILLAHAAYRLADEYRRRHPDARILEATTPEATQAQVGEADVLVASGFWRNAFAVPGGRLRFVQSVSAGTDQYDREAFRAAGLRLASAQGVNERAVSEHALALLLAITRHVPQAVQDMAAGRWRPMIGDPAIRQDELSGRHMLVVGLGRIGNRVARLASAFDMRVTGLRRSPLRDDDVVSAVIPPDRLLAALPDVDVVVLTCPLTAETDGLIGRDAFAAMKPGAILVNVARGRVVDQDALLAALGSGRLAAAALDVTVEEPLPPSSPLWSLPNVLVTPHTAGETRRYEANVVDLLDDNLARLAAGRDLRNGIV